VKTLMQSSLSQLSLLLVGNRLETGLSKVRMLPTKKAHSNFSESAG